MGPDRIVMAPPAFDDDLSFVEGVEDLAIEQLIAQARVEALDVAVLPRTAPLDVGSLGADSGDPRPRSGGSPPSCLAPARPEHPPGAASRRSLRACIASLPLQSSLMSKTYLKSDHFNGGGSARDLRPRWPTVYGADWSCRNFVSSSVTFPGCSCCTQWPAP